MIKSLFNGKNKYITIISREGVRIKYSKIIMGTLFLIFILMIGAVSATNDGNNSLSSNDLDKQITHTDINTHDKVSHVHNNIINENKDNPIDTKTESGTNDTKNINQKQNDQKLQTKNNQENILKENNEPQSFTNLNTTIQGNLSNHEITLEHDYTYTDTDGNDL